MARTRAGSRERPIRPETGRPWMPGAGGWAGLSARRADHGVPASGLSRGKQPDHVAAVAGGAEEPGMTICEATISDAPMIAAVHRASRRAAMPWLPDLHTPDEDVRFFSTMV